jgi:hypothetical protein
MKANWQWEKLKKESEAQPEVFGQRIRDQIEKGHRNPLTIALMNAVIRRPNGSGALCGHFVVRQCLDSRPPATKRELTIPNRSPADVLFPSP